MQGFLLLLICSYASDSAGCDCGFMSLERIRILLGLETVGDRIFSPHRQQITPDIKFTCDGLITKWILGADWHNDGTLYPELQVWRKSRNDIYHKKNGTVINVLSQSPTNIYKYDAFSPIPFLAGDILGIFLPQMANSKLRLWSERGNGPIVYHVDTGSSVESPVDAIDLKRISLLSTTSYLPLVTVEIGIYVYVSMLLMYSSNNSMFSLYTHSCEQPYKVWQFAANPHTYGTSGHTSRSRLHKSDCWNRW